MAQEQNNQPNSNQQPSEQPQDVTPGADTSQPKEEHPLEKSMLKKSISSPVAFFLVAAIAAMAIFIMLAMVGFGPAVKQRTPTQAPPPTQETSGDEVTPGDSDEEIEQDLQNTELEGFDEEFQQLDEDVQILQE